MSAAPMLALLVRAPARAAPAKGGVLGATLYANPSTLDPMTGNLIGKPRFDDVYLEG